MRFPLELWLYLAAANITAFAAFGYDKARAKAGRSRVRERDLLLFALLGGTGGAYLGRWYFRHKTRKRGFTLALHAVALVQALLVAAAIMPLSHWPASTNGGL